jgi:hypothetical protein
MKTATPMANPRIRIGKISDNSSHVTVEMKHCWKNANTTMNNRIV